MCCILRGRAGSETSPIKWCAKNKISTLVSAKGATTETPRVLWHPLSNDGHLEAGGHTYIVLEVQSA